MQSAEDDRRGQGEFTTWYAVLARRLRLSFIDKLEDVLAGSNVGGAGIREREFARRAHEQPCFQASFEIGDLSADRGQRHAEPAAGCGEATGLNRSDK